MTLKIFCDQNYLPEGMTYEAILYPFWGKPPENPEDPISSCFDHYVEIGKSLFKMSSLEEADFAIVPVNWALWNSELEDKARELAENVKSAGKPLISFFGGASSHLNLPIESDFVFRNSLYRSLRKNTDFTLPQWSEDFVENYLNNKLNIRQKRLKPVVGFCGYAVKPNTKTYLKFLWSRVKKNVLNLKTSIPPYNWGYMLRLQALDILAKDPNIITNFMIRERPVFFNQPDFQLKQKHRLEFVHNLIDSDYIFCCRGSGNNSFRFYEALCCGRIPVLVDTDCVLPYDFDIDWKKYCVWIKENELHLIGNKIAEFHDNLSSREFVDLQYECRRIWKERVSPEGFFSNFHRHLPIAKGTGNREQATVGCI
ncbi:MAG: exostosin family protein [Moorea sp. SIO2I5]|nr:exostosin family protein [Moorena sp. SIO2I5]